MKLIPIFLAALLTTGLANAKLVQVPGVKNQWVESNSISKEFGGAKYNVVSKLHDGGVMTSEFRLYCPTKTVELESLSLTVKGETKTVKGSSRDTTSVRSEAVHRLMWQMVCED